MSTDIARRQQQETALAIPAEMTIEELVARTRKVQEAMKAVMHEGEHYGVIPGTGDKPTLLKPGAEKLLNLFMLDPEYDAPPLYEGDHLTIVSRCTLYHIPSGARVGSGMGMCSTREVKYAYRTSKRVCPKCGAEKLNKSRYPPKGKPNAEPGWYCHAKFGGCGAEFAADDPGIVNQVVGRVDNPDKADQYNTVLKMANKRSLVAAVLNVTGASDIFTQDLEDLPVVNDNHREASDAATSAPGTGAPSGSGAVTTGNGDLFEGNDSAAPAPADGNLLIGRIEARWAKLKTPAKVQTSQWDKHVGAAVQFLSPTADPAALSDLLAALGETP